jgi:hypothetical protein
VATEGLILVPANVTGGNAIRSLLLSTQASGEGAPTNKAQQVATLGDPNTAANLAGVLANGALQVNMASSVGTIQSTAGVITAAAAQVTGTASTAGQVVADVSLAGNVEVSLISAAFVGTLVFEASLDAAGTSTSWGLKTLKPEDANAAYQAASSVPLSIAAQTIRLYSTGMLGPKLFKIRCSAFTSGSIAVVIQPGPGWVEENPNLGPSQSFIGYTADTSASAFTLTTATTSGTVNTNTQVLAADNTRKGITLWNTGSGLLRVGHGVPTTTALYNYLVQPGSGYEVPSKFVQASLQVQSPTASNTVNVGTAV